MIGRVVDGMSERGRVLAGAESSPKLDRPGETSRLEWVSMTQGADWWASDLRAELGRFRFRIFHRGRYVIEVRLRVPGLRSVVGALAAAAACNRLGVTSTDVRDGLEAFAGLARDFQGRGSFRGVTLVDDLADDARSVHDAIALARQAFGSRRLWAVYGIPGVWIDPIEASRYIAAFSLANLVLITEAARTDEPPNGQLALHPSLVEVLANAGLPVWRTSGLAESISELDGQLKPGDVLLTLGSGGVGTIADAFLRRLPRDRSGG
jgi:UDP-N-acetylmuramate-alanine ligase